MENTGRPIINGIQMPPIMQMRINGVIRVVDFTTMDKMVGKPEGYSEALFNTNKDRFTKYMDYFYTRDILNLTETGCLLLARLFDVDTDASFAIQRYIFQELVINREYTYQRFHKHTVECFERDKDRIVRKFESEIRQLNSRINYKNSVIKHLEDRDEQEDECEDQPDSNANDYDPELEFDQFVDRVSDLIIMNANNIGMVHDMIPTRHFVAFYNIDELKLHSILTKDAIKSEDDYDSLPYIYKLYDSYRYVRHDWNCDTKSIRTMFWTESGIRFLVDLLARDRIYPLSQYAGKLPD